MSFQLKSHAARDVLAVAEEYSNLNKAVWEYVTNGLQYGAPGRRARVYVRVDVRRQLISIRDNGKGMDEADLRRFLTMHAPNEDRLRGQYGRGRYGTGKAAAFGIGKVLRVTSVQRGRLWAIEVRRSDLEALDRKPDALEVPVRELQRGQPTNLPDGVLVEIERFRISVRDKDVDRLRRFMSTRLRRYPDGSVVLNGRPCIPPRIEALPQYDRRVKAPPEVAEMIGPAELELHVAAGPLDADTRGVYAWVSGQRLALGLGGNTNTQWAHRIFGDVDVDGLDPDRHREWPSPFTQGRREEINLENPGAFKLWNWVGFEVQRLLEELEEEERAKRDAEEQQHLRMLARQIAQLLNEDYLDEEDTLQRPRQVAGPDAERPPGPTGGAAEALVHGGEETAVTAESPTTTPGGSGGDGSGQDAGNEPLLTPDESGEPVARRSPGTSGSRRRQGGFAIHFRHLGEGDDRGRYEAALHAIVINLDHPEVVWARHCGGDVERTVFREIALVEYAFALGQHQAEQEGGSLLTDTTRVLVDTRERIHRVTRRLPEVSEPWNDEATT